MAEEPNDPIEDLLRERFEGAVPEDGFSGKVMQRLPQRRRFQGWLPAVGVLLGAVASGVGLFWGRLPEVVWRGGTSGHMTGAVIVWMAIAGGISMMGMGWAVVEGDDLVVDRS